MAHRVCPWWLGYLLACPWRRRLQDPAGILGSFVREGMTVLEPGPGMGFFTLELARQVGPAGRVVAVDIQPKMIAALKRRAAKQGLAGCIETRLAGAESMGLDDLAGQVDFVLAFAVVHELPSVERFFREVAGVLKTTGSVLVAEPAGHVTAEQFEEQMRAAEQAGLQRNAGPTIRRSLTAVLRRV
jgi:ubiquinone/menaquinone biosynthesis C-methylase UbiE